MQDAERIAKLNVMLKMYDIKGDFGYSESMSFYSFQWYAENPNGHPLFHRKIFNDIDVLESFIQKTCEESQNTSFWQPAFD